MSKESQRRESWSKVIRWWLAAGQTERLAKLASAGLEHAVRAAGSTAGVLWVFDGSDLHLLVTYNFPRSLFSARTISRGEGLSGRAVLEKKAFISNELPSDNRVALRDTGFTELYRSAMVVPIMVVGHPFGAMNIFAKKPRRFSNADIVWSKFAGQKLALCLHQCALFPELAADWMAQIRFDLRILTPEKTRFGTFEPSPKGIQEATLNAIHAALRGQAQPLTGGELAAATGLSQTTLRHYLLYMAEEGLVRRSPSYGKPGRPAYRYSVAPPAGPAT